MSEVNPTPTDNRLDSNGLLYLFHRMKEIFTGMFQGKEAGKGLSTNDYTTAEKNKLAGAVTGVTMNGAAKAVDQNGMVDLGTVITEATDISGKADKTDTVLNTTLSMGRKANTTVGANSTALGDNVESSGAQSFATGSATQATGAQSHAEGLGGTFSIDGVSYTSKAGGTADHVEGYKCVTSQSQPGNHAEGYQTRATGGASHSEGQNTLASGNNSHAEGSDTKATNSHAHAEGHNTTASGVQAHAEGFNTTASSNQAHSEGSYSTASGAISHAEGVYSTASARYSHAEGTYTTSSGESSHSEGDHTQAAGRASHVSGMYNVTDSYNNWPEWTANTEYSVGDKVKVIQSGGTVSGYVCKTANNDSTIDYTKWTYLNGQMNYAEIIGNGTADESRSNARVLDWSGNERLMGDVYVGCNPDSTGGIKLAKEYSPTFTGTPTVPTASTNDNSTKIASTAFVKNAIAAALDGRVELDFQFLDELPQTGVKGIFYFIPKEDPETGDVWDEYVWNGDDEVFELIGSAKVDLTGYYNTTNLPAITNAEIDTILAT